jgi:hypothetical protein
MKGAERLWDSGFRFRFRFKVQLLEGGRGRCAEGQKVVVGGGLVVR